MPSGSGSAAKQKAAAMEPAAAKAAAAAEAAAAAAAAAAMEPAAAGAANGQDNAELSIERPSTDSSLLENALLVREGLTLTDRRSFLAGTPPSIEGTNLGGGVRLDPGGKSIYGYAWDKNRPREPLSVICFLNDRAIFLCVANKDNYRWKAIR